MSRISQDFINTIGYLYEEINVQEHNFLNEESDYYDEETTEIVEDILSTISVSMVYEGYSVEGIIGFLADSSEQDIIEKYLSFDENILTESVVSKDYIVEQLEIFDVAIEEGIGSLIGKVAKGAVSLAGRVASKPARVAVAKKMMTSKNPAKTAAAVDRLARMKLNKAGAPSDITKKLVDAAPDVSTKTRIAATAPVVGKLVKGAQKVKDIAQGAKKALPGIAKGAGIFGLGAAGGFVGAKLAGAGGDGKVGPKIVGPKIVGPKIVGPKPSSPSGSGGRDGLKLLDGGGSSTSSAASSKPNSAKSSPKPAGQTGNKDKDMETWAKANPKLAANVKPGQSGYDVISRMRDKPSSYEKQDQTPTQGSPTAQIDPKSIESDIRAEQERLKKKMDQQNTTTTTKESYEPYDILLDYLIGGGHADTIEEAHYIMLEMDESAVGAVMEQYEDYLIAEEVSEWVDSLVDEGYDLSEYTWDDMVEYYVNEAKKEEGLPDKQKRRIRRSRLPHDGGKGKRAEEIRQDWHRSQRGKRGESPLASNPRYENEPGRRIRGQGYVRYSNHEDDD